MRCFKENPDDSEGIGYVFLPSYADMDETEVDILAGMPGIALIGSLLLTIIIFILDRLPLAKTAMILVVNGDAGKEQTASVMELVEKIAGLSKIHAVSLMSHDGEVTF